MASDYQGRQAFPYLTPFIETGFIMVATENPNKQHELANRIQVRTGKRIRNLGIHCSTDEIILTGDTSTYYVKQLAQHGVRDLLPNIRLHNRINVD